MAAKKRSRADDARNTSTKDPSTAPVDSIDVRLAEALDLTRRVLLADAEDLDADEVENLTPLDRNLRTLLAACKQFNADVATLADEGQRPFERSGRLAEIPMRLQWLASELLPGVALLAFGREAPVGIIAKANEWAEALHTPSSRPLLRWQEGLVESIRYWAAVSHFQGGYPIGPRADLNAFALVIDGIADHIGDDAIPDAMNYASLPGRPLSREHRRRLDNAVDVLRKMKVARTTRGERPGGKAGLLSPFGAAARFAEALGLRFPEREFDVKRPARTRRPLSERTTPVLKERSRRTESTHAQSSNARGSRSSR